MQGFYQGLIFIFLSALGFGVMPIFVKYAYQYNVSVPTLLFLRFAMAAGVFFLYLLLTNKIVPVTKKQILALFILGGVGYTLQSTCYFSAVKFITPTLVALLLYTYPIFVAVLSVIIDREKILRQVVLAIGLSFAGLILVLGTSFGKINFYGVLFGLGAGFIYSCYILIANRVLKDLPSMVASAFIALFASLSFLTVGLFSGSINLNFAAVAWGPILGVVICSTIIAMFAFFRGLELLGSTKASALSMVEPLITSIFSAWFFSERLTIYQIFGGLAVMSGAVLVVLARDYRNQQETIIIVKAD